MYERLDGATAFNSVGSAMLAALSVHQAGAIVFRVPSHLRLFRPCVRSWCESNLEQADKAEQWGARQRLANCKADVDASNEHSNLPVRHGHRDVVQIVALYSKDCASDPRQ